MSAPRYLANHFAERLVNNRSCRLGAGATGTDIATLGESTRNASGYLKGRHGRRRILQRGWDAFLRTGDSNGIPDQNDVIVMHRAMFPGLPDPAVIQTRDFDSLWRKHGAFAISWALDLRAVPADSVLRKYVNPVPHQMTTYQYRNVIRVVDPWKQHDPSYHGLSHPRLRSDIRKAARAMAGGLIFAELYPVGQWTEAARVAAAKDERIDEIKQRRDALRRQLDEATTENAALIEQLEECRSSTGENAVGDFIDRQIEWLEEQRP